MQFTTELEVESWCLYALGAITLASRLVSRRMKLGDWKLLAVDDYLMLFAFVCFTMVVICINEVAKNGSNYMAPEVAAALTPAGVKQAIYGSIMTFVLEVFTLTATWTIKICLLIFYTRLTVGTNRTQKLIIKAAFCYCILAYLLIMILMLVLWCKPVTGYWAVPVQDEQCATYYHHMIFATSWNVLGDIILFIIPIPVISKLQLPLKKKVIIICILGLGLFNILATVLNRYYNFSNPNSYIFLCWYVAEVAIAVFVGNLPFCWPLFRLIIGDRSSSSAASRPQMSTNRSFKRKSQAIQQTMGSRSAWDKIEDGSDSSSQVELVAVEPNKSSSIATSEQQRQGSAGQIATTQARVLSDGQYSRQAVDDKITVTTVVDVTYK